MTRSESLPLPPTVFLLGKMAAGKDFAGTELVKQRGYTRIALADALKDEVAAAKGVTRAYLDKHKGEFRAALQARGAEARRDNLNYWIDRWAEKRAKVKGPVVCTDCRHVNEAEFADKFPDSVTVKIELDDRIRLERIRAIYGDVTDAMLSHPSETEQDFCRFHLIIPGTLPAARIPNVLAKQYLGWKDMGRPTLVKYGSKPC